ncbi:MAG: class I SAM-dependent methyltransferase [Eubacterium sp.]|nr:class I SAM-dependent methyltransferase [Eubacterium sp.]MDD7209720.1 class I SAM-dependent methyltransferase [Lachnospiraceae bacterium]MDY5497325.1 class I SAM-dependent methyltransferase [Anaerobutyricum sp.]
MGKRIAITQWCHERIRQLVKNPEICIDATAGTGKDTVFLCELVGEQGNVISMDVQEKAVQMTKDRLKEKNFTDRTRVVLDGHEHMERYAGEGSVSLIMFNLGYLPGGDHSVATKKETTIAAIKTGLTLLKAGGVISLMIYSGGDSGFEEKEAVLSFLKDLPQQEYTVIVENFYNKSNDPPLPVYIIKQEE